MDLALGGTTFFLILCSLGIVHADYPCEIQEGNITQLFATTSSVTILWTKTNAFTDFIEKNNSFLMRHRLRTPYNIYVPARLKLSRSGYYIYHEARYLNSTKAPWKKTKVSTVIRGDASTDQLFATFKIRHLPHPGQEYEIQMQWIRSHESLHPSKPFRGPIFDARVQEMRCVGDAFHNDTYKFTVRTLDRSLRTGSGLFFLDNNVRIAGRRNVTLFWTPAPGPYVIRMIRIDDSGNQKLVPHNVFGSAMDGNCTTEISWDRHEFSLSRPSQSTAHSRVLIPALTGDWPFVDVVPAFCAWRNDMRIYQLTWQRPRETRFRVSSYTIAVMEIVVRPDDTVIYKMLASIKVKGTKSVLEIKGVGEQELWKTRVFAMSINAASGSSSGLNYFFRKVEYDSSFQKKVEEWSRN